MKSELVYFFRVIAIVFLLVLLFPVGLYSGTNNENLNQEHEITIFVIPSLAPIDWTNPSNLLKSLELCFIKSLQRKNPYIIGHTIARITSPLLPEPYYVAMSGAVPVEKVELVLVKKVGLGALGATIQGHMEPKKNIRNGLQLYAKRNMLAFVKYKVNQHSLIRMLQFVNQYQKKICSNFASCDFYNGATWPRYQNEGSGCSAFGMTLLDVANIVPPVSCKWRVDIKIPMDLVGGEFNNHRKIKLSSIRQTKSWYNGSGVVDVDYVEHNIYDPSIIFNWILNERKQRITDFQLDEENGIPGLVVDKSSIVVDVEEPIFQMRKDSNLFIKHYHRRIRNLGLN